MMQNLNSGQKVDGSQRAFGVYGGWESSVSCIGGSNAKKGLGLYCILKPVFLAFSYCSGTKIPKFLSAHGLI